MSDKVNEHLTERENDRSSEANLSMASSEISNCDPKDVAELGSMLSTSPTAASHNGLANNDTDLDHDVIPSGDVTRIDDDVTTNDVTQSDDVTHNNGNTVNDDMSRNDDISRNNDVTRDNNVTHKTDVSALHEFSNSDVTTSKIRPECTNITNGECTSNKISVVEDEKELSCVEKSKRVLFIDDEKDIVEIEENEGNKALFISS